MILRTVGDLKKALEEFPDAMPIEGYDGRDGGRLVSVYLLDYSEVDDGEKPPPTVVISTD